MYRKWFSNLLVMLLFFMSSNMNNAQNLIYNGDFELYDTCPASASTPGDLQIEHCLGWTCPRLLGTSDYFNICNNVTAFAFAGVPNNGIGYQYPYNGNGYCGLFAWGLTLGEEHGYREYIQQEIPSSLIKGRAYYFKMELVLASDGYSVEKIGALFSSNNYVKNSFQPIVASPQIKNNKGYIIDTLNWTRIEGYFFADGSEKFLTIGYFEDSLNFLDTLKTSPNPYLFASYYYVDAIEMYEVDLHVPNVFTPNNDGVNDVFEFSFYYDSLVIMDRWGNRVFESGSDKKNWNGETNSGEKLNDGTYFYVIYTGELKLAGFVQLLR